MRVRGPLERERLADQRVQPTGRGLGEGGPCQFAQLCRGRTDAPDQTDLASLGFFVRDFRERAARNAERAEATAITQQVEGGTADASAHAIEDDINAPHLRGQTLPMLSLSIDRPARPGSRCYLSPARSSAPGGWR
jgi:hypothetical protein